MNRALEIVLSAIVVIFLTFYLGRSFKLSNRYERKPQKLSDWNAKDQGIDPTQEIESDR